MAKVYNKTANNVRWVPNIQASKNKPPTASRACMESAPLRERQGGRRPKNSLGSRAGNSGQLVGGGSIFFSFTVDEC